MLVEWAGLKTKLALLIGFYSDLYLIAELNVDYVVLFLSIFIQFSRFIPSAVCLNLERYDLINTHSHGFGTFWDLMITGLLLGLRPANERRRYKVTPSLIGCAQPKNRPVIEYLTWGNRGPGLIHRHQGHGTILWHNKSSFGYKNGNPIWTAIYL